jgi:hypothetical protein
MNKEQSRMQFEAFAYEGLQFGPEQFARHSPTGPYQNGMLQRFYETWDRATETAINQITIRGINA